MEESGFFDNRELSWLDSHVRAYFRAVVDCDPAALQGAYDQVCEYNSEQGWRDFKDKLSWFRVDLYAFGVSEGKHTAFFR